MRTSTATKLNVFISYSHKDEEFRNRLEVHLSPLARENLIHIWYDRKIGAGGEWEAEISESLESADIILLLVSPDLIASDYCWEVEIERAMRRHNAGEALVIPIILRATDWSNAPFAKLQALPINATPIDEWTHQDEAFLDVVGSIRSGIEHVIERKKRNVDRQKKWSCRARIFAILFTILIGAAAIIRPLWKDEPCTVAVLGFANQTEFAESMAWIEVAMTEILVEGLKVDGEINVLFPEAISEARVALSIDDLEDLNDKQIQELQIFFGIDFLIHGKYFGYQPTPLKIELNLQDTATGKVRGRYTVEASTDRLVELLNEAVAPLRLELGAPDLTNAERAEVRGLFPLDPKALELYSEGLRRLRRFDDLGALKKLDEAISIEPDNPRLHSTLGDILLSLGQQIEAADEFSEAMSLGTNLSERNQREIEARRLQAAGKQSAAAQIYYEIWKSNIWDLRLAISCLEAWIWANELRNALTTLKELRDLPIPEASQRELDLVEAQAQVQLGNLIAARESISRALAASDRLGSFFGARAHFHAAEIYEISDDFSRAVAELKQACILFKLAGDERSLWEAYERMAIILAQEGEFDKAREALVEFFGKRQKDGDAVGEVRSLANLGVIYTNMGYFKEAKNVLQDALATSLQIGDVVETAAIINNIAAVSHKEGNLLEAQHRYEEALRLYKELGRMEEVALVKTNLGEIYFLIGDLDKAREMHWTARQVNARIESSSGYAYDSFRLAKVAFFQGNIVEANELFSQAIERQQAFETRIPYAETLLGIVELELFEFDFKKAREHVLEAHRILLEEGMSNLAALAEILHARTLLELPVPDLEKAEEISDQVRHYAERSQDPQVRYQSDLLAARIRIRVADNEDDFSEARKTLQELAQTALDSRSIPDHFEARLALVEAEIHAGNPSSVREAVNDLIGEARAIGFEVIVERARRLHQLSE